jgi:subtilisin family serine protease
MSDVLAADDSLLVIHTSPTDSVAVQAYPNCYDEAETCYDVELYSTNETIGIETPLSFEVFGNTAPVECWRYNGQWTTSALNPRLSAGEPTHNILSPSSAPRVICVGATTYRDGVTNRLGHWQSYWGGEHGRRAPYSSMGPTMDGRTKPDVVAPGNYVVSAVSSYFMEGREPEFGAMKWIVSDFDFQGRTYGWCAAMGTSQSGPVVAGIIALWLQANPTLTPEDVMGVIRRTSRQPDPSLPSPNNEYGYGQIDVYRGLLRILGIDGIDGLSQHQPRAVSILPIGEGRVRIRFEGSVAPDVPHFSVSVFSTSGQMVSKQTLAGGQAEYNLDFSMLSRGVYAVQVSTCQPVTTGSTLIRL